MDLVQRSNRIVPMLDAEIRQVQLSILPVSPKWRYWRNLQDLVQYFYIGDVGCFVPEKKYNIHLKRALGSAQKRWVRYDWEVLPDPPIEFIIDRLIEISEVLDEEVGEWLKEQLYRALQIIPVPVLRQGGYGKLTRTVSGVLMYSILALDSDANAAQVRQRIFSALKGGMFFGLMYPLVDDVMDLPDLLSPIQKEEYARYITNLALGMTNEPDHDFPYDLQTHFCGCFRNLENLLEAPRFQELVKNMLVLHISQLEDGMKSSRYRYSDEDIYPPLILKAAYTRIIAAILGGFPIQDEFRNNMIKNGLGLQMVDDFRDFQKDLKRSQFTPFTHFHKFGNDDNVNPMLLYLASLQELMDRHGNRKSCSRQIVRRFSHAVRRFAQTHADDQMHGFLTLFLSDTPSLRRSVARLIRLSSRITDIDFQISDTMTKIAVTQAGRS